jgi:signal transduction histidine kinase
MKALLEKIFPSVGKKIAVAIIGVSLLAGGLFVFYAHKTGYQMMDQHTQAKAHGISSLIKNILEQAMLEGRSDHLEQALGSVTQSPDIIDAYILKQDGTIFLRAKQGGILGKFPLTQFHDIPGREGEKYLSAMEHDSLYEYVVTPVLNKPACQRCHTDGNALRGYIAMKIAMADVRSISLEHRTTNIAMVFLTFAGVSIITFVALSILVIKPIRGLHSHIRHFENDVQKLERGEKTDFPLLAEPQGRDEIVDLCRTFNNLMRSLNEANAKVFEMHQVQLEQADRLATTGEMAASIAHEIKNPIAGVLGALQVFESDLPEHDERNVILAEMMVQLGRIDQAVNDLLSYARPAPPVFEEVNLNALIQKTLTLFSQQLKGKPISIHTDLPNDSINISADQKQFQQVLWNIMLNGMQAIESSGTLSIKTRCENHHVVVRIVDTGKGIPSAQLERVFRPFYTTKHKGTGLGMTVSRRIVEQHKGTIKIESQAGKGTAVIITLPEYRNHR